MPVTFLISPAILNLFANPGNPTLKPFFIISSHFLQNSGWFYLQMNVANWYCNLSLKLLPATYLKFNTRTQWCSYNYYTLYIHNFIFSNKAITATFLPCILLKLQQRLCVLLQQQNHQYEHPGLWKKKKRLEITLKT